MCDFTGKKLLIIGGAFQHCKLVEVAREMGVITYVVDYLPIEKAPAKQIADFHYEYNITDYDDILEMCKREHIDGILSSHLDACQLPYQVICERLNLPCFGTKEQFRIMTDKTAFIQKCIECGIDIIPQYTEADFACKEECKVEFPVFVKPCDSCGSKGQTICYTFDEMPEAIRFAKSQSKTGKVIIEKFMDGKQDFSMSYLVINGVPYLVRTGDRFVGSHEDKMDKSALCEVSPSSYAKLYLDKVDEKIKQFIISVGIKNGPVFMQGFIDGDKIRFYDPGLRFPGIEYDRMYYETTGVNTCKALVEFALTGKISAEYENIDTTAMLNGKRVADLFVVVRPGVVSKIDGLEKILSEKKIISVSQKVHVGDTIGEWYNVNQRFGEFDIVADDTEDLCRIVEFIFDNLHVTDTNGNEMVFAKFNPNVLLNDTN